MVFIFSPCLPSTIPSQIMSIAFTAYLSNSRRRSSCSLLLWRWFTHLFQNGIYPRFFGSTYTMPQRDIVAGEANCKSYTSNNKAQCFCRRIRSPFARVSNRLSSMTEFMFSTHRASTSPSNTMYLRSFFSVGLFISRKMFESNPSVQSRVFGSRIPYNSMTLRSLGLIVKSLVSNPNLYQIENTHHGTYNARWIKRRVTYCTGTHKIH